MAKKVCVLSIDGGGIRQIIPSVIIKYLESELLKQASSKALSDYFDFFIGTDLGGVTASLLVIPDENGKPKYNAKDVLSFFVEKGSSVFDVSIWKRLRSIGGMTDEMYSARKLDKLLMSLLADNKLGDVLKPLMLSSYDIRNRQANIYNCTDAKDPIRNFYIRDLCRASAAIPSFFEPARVKSETGTPFSLVSGSMFAANPTMLAYAEARKMNFSKVLNNPDKPIFPTIKDMLVVSIGTGNIDQPYYYNTAKDWGNLNWLGPIMDMNSSANKEIVDYQIRQLFSTLSADDDYFRINPKLVGISSGIDDASDENIRNLVTFSEQFVEEHKIELDQIVSKLIAYNT